MENKQNTVWIKTILFVLIFICIIQGYVIYSKIYQGNSQVASVNSVTDLSSNLNQNYNQNQKQDQYLFDQFFNNNFFSDHRDPFAEIEKLHEQIQNSINSNHQTFFNNSWDNWFNNRFSFSDNGLNQMGIKFNIEDKDKYYLVTIEIPNSKNNQINIDIKEHHIRLEGHFTQVKEQKNNFGDIVSKSEIRQSLNKIISIPADADYKNASIKNETDKIIINLPKN